MASGLFIMDGKREYLLLRRDGFFHILLADEALTGEVRRRLDDGCTVEQMQEMGLSGTTIPESGINALSVEGYGVGDELIFHLKKGKRRYVFARRYESRTGDAFFKGIPRLRTKRIGAVRGGKKHRDWRYREQNPKVRKKVRIAAVVLNVTAAAASLGLLFVKRLTPLWAALGTLCAAAGLYLLVFFGAYVSIMEKRDFEKAGYSAPVRRIWLLFMPGLILGYRVLSAFVFLQDGVPWMFGIGFALAVGVILWLFVQEAQDHPQVLLVAVLLCFVMGIGLLGYGNHIFATEEMTCHTLQVEDMYASTRSRGSDYYYCCVTLPDGREVKIEVGEADYSRLAVGDTITVPMRTGAFGIEYIYYGYNE